MGVLGWTPDRFWAATFWDLFRAIDGWREAQGHTSEPEMMDLQDYADLVRMFDGDDGSP